MYIALAQLRQLRGDLVSFIAGAPTTTGAPAPAAPPVSGPGAR
jgi:hypothetical protein